MVYTKLRLNPRQENAAFQRNYKNKFLNRCKSEAERKRDSLEIIYNNLIKQIFHLALANVTRKVTNIEGTAGATHLEKIDICIDCKKRKRRRIRIFKKNRK